MSATSTVAPANLDGVEHGFDNGGRGRFNAWFFDAFDGYIGHLSRRHKDAAFGGIEPGTVVEIGAGVGANFGYLPAGSHLVAIEPNHAMHERLQRRAEQRSVDIEIVGTSGVDTGLADDSVDDVLCSLVLCTVPDQQAVLAEIRRILRPGGRFRFVEHVAAPAWSPRRWMQHAITRPWRWVFEGCELCRDTAGAVETAGFSEVEVHRRRMRHSVFVPINTSITGIAVK